MLKMLSYIKLVQHPTDESARDVNPYLIDYMLRIPIGTSNGHIVSLRISSHSQPGAERKGESTIVLHIEGEGLIPIEGIGVMTDIDNEEIITQKIPAYKEALTGVEFEPKYEDPELFEKTLRLLQLIWHRLVFFMIKYQTGGYLN